jgi:antitoxin component YwqK of YwqJK toxin-antitoxin module
MLLKKLFILFFSFPVVVSAQFVDSSKQNYAAFYYENGNIASEGYMTNGKPNEYWITYYRNQLRKSEGNRKNFMLDSTWKFYRENGNLKTIINYKQDLKNGTSYYFNDDCQLIKEESYRKGKLHGKQINYYPTTDSLLVLKSLTHYENGVKQGFAFEYAKDGRIVSLVNYKDGYVSDRESINRKDEKGRKQGIWKSYYPNFRVKKEERYKDDRLNGYVKLYNVEGRLESASLYIDGVKQSEEENTADFKIQNESYSDDSLKTQSAYNLAGKKDGISNYFDEEGQVKKTELYRNGYLLSRGIIDKKGVYQGMWENYYLNGELKSKGSYENGKKVGKWEYYYQNGKLEQIGFYDKNGKYTGEWKWFYDNGQMLRKEEFRRGLEDGLLEEFDRSGKLITKGEFFDGEKEGEWFYELNDHREEGKYRYGERNGLWIHYYPNGKKSFEGRYAEGVEEGKHEYYYPNGVSKRKEEYSYGEKVGKWQWFEEDGTETLSITYKNGKPKRINGSRVNFSDI